MKFTAILILNWNGAEDTISCLENLWPQLGGEDYLFVIDNGSSDGSPEKIESYLKSCSKDAITNPAEELSGTFTANRHFYLCSNRSNLGFGAGNNTVLRQLKKLDTRFELAWLLNNDALPQPGALSSLKNTISSDSKNAVAGSLILNYPDTSTIQCAGVAHYKFFGVSKLILKNKPCTSLDKTKVIHFEYLNGASILFNLEALAVTGFFDERFFLYSEEFDLQLRLKKRGYKMALDLNSVVYHKLGGGTSSRKYLFYYYYNSSAILLSKKHFSWFFTSCATINLVGITALRTFPSIKNFTWGIKGILKGLRSA